MEFQEIPAPFDGFIRDLVARRGAPSGLLDAPIDPRDEMFFKGVLPSYGGDVGRASFRYFESAVRTFEVYAQLADKLGGFDRLERVLDFGSGWGRLTRALSQVMPADRIWVTDLYHEAVAWLAETYGVHGVLSAEHPDRFKVEGSFSLVFAASVFSHLPDALFRAWLQRLYRLVAPNGLLAFSVHHSDLLPEGERSEAAALAYHGWSESGSLGADVYGMSYVAEPYVAAAVRELRPGRPPQMRRFARGLFENQDLYVVAGDEVDISRLHLDISPLGGMRPMEASGPQDVVLQGWGVDFNPASQIERVELAMGDHVVATAQPTADNEAALAIFPNPPNMPVRWTMTVRRDQLEPGRMLRVALRSARSQRIAYAYAASPAGVDDVSALGRT
ncbi:MULTISPECIES: trans-aconitate 2-methyltransferase [unclassified Phenylobacterium]|uniref:class I SAM-dependent methyltransferase n=1 Tax=unclassified Phenylobacterium TaxID=2640670 RepID=UPI00083A18A5|nr:MULTISPECIES: class I SAM-dependent methyltransferase [unclassified Phenylobacterium]